MRVIFTAAAEIDLETIGDYIAQSNPSCAVSFVREMREKCLGLREMPQAFPLVDDNLHAGIRRRVHGNYLIFYRIGGEAVEILRVLHGAMEYERMLFPED
jgi:plasmid stabilization system protein ParE